MSEIVVDIKNLTKRYGEFTALEDLSIALERGKILGFIGPNGAGKTTTIKILVGLSKPTSGSASIEGADCFTQSRKIKKLVGYMPDRFGSYDNMRVHEYLDFFGSAFQIPRRLRRKRIDEVLETTSSTYMKDRYVESLSHGMQQRVGIARTLLHDPAVMILDEPANGLDPTARVEMRNILLRLAEMGKTLIVTSHILPELSRICDTVAIISGGKLRASGTLDQIMETVRQNRLLEIGLSDLSHADKAKSAIKKFVVDGTEVEYSEAERAIRFRTEIVENQWHEMISSLVSEGITINQFREIQSDLEDAFLTVTGQDSEKATDVAKAASGESNTSESVSAGTE